jgi:hypothetical protein
MEAKKPRPGLFAQVFFPKEFTDYWTSFFTKGFSFFSPLAFVHVAKPALRP